HQALTQSQIALRLENRHVEGKAILARGFLRVTRFPTKLWRDYGSSVEMVASPAPSSNACSTALQASIAHLTRCGNLRTPFITRRSPSVLGASLSSSVTRS